MAFRQQWDLAADDDFRRRVQMAMCSAAVAIQSEPGSTPNHTNRANFARLALNDPDRYMPRFAMAICAYDTALAPSAGDTSILDNVSAVWNALAGTV